MSVVRYSKVMYSDGTRDDFCAFYSNVKTEGAQEREQIESDARADQPEWGDPGKVLRIEWVERPLSWTGRRFQEA